MGHKNYILAGWITLALLAMIGTFFLAACGGTDSRPSQPETTDDTVAVVETEMATATPTLRLPVTDTPPPTAALQPYPYTTPLPPPTPTHLDGVYTRVVSFAGTPTPCRRCAPYRAEGGTWTLQLDRGLFRLAHDGTGFTGIGAFTLSDRQLTLFNDPNCHLGIGTYDWALDGRSLILTTVADDCAFGLRAKNLGAGSWLKQVDVAGQPIDPCQPPNTEAAVTGHWPAPAGCLGEN